MPGLISRSTPNRRSPKVNPELNRPAPDAPIFITAAAVAGSVLSLTFDTPVALDGVPAYTTDIAGAVPVSAVTTSPTTVEITFDIAIDLAVTVNLPHRDRAIRNSSGGYVTSNTFPV